MARKTVDVEYVRNLANTIMARESASVDERKTAFYMAEAVLMETGNYHGFNWLHWTQEHGYEDWRAAGSPEGSEKNPFIYGAEEDTYRCILY